MARIVLNGQDLLDAPDRFRAALQWHLMLRSDYFFFGGLSMHRFSRLIGKLRRSEEGATMIEYGLLAALVSIASLAALQLLGPALLAIFNQVVTAITGA
jgi:pilus assembly protein Flp/PilA